jgi:hypothetical protein
MYYLVSSRKAVFPKMCWSIILRLGRGIKLIVNKLVLFILNRVR